MARGGRRQLLYLCIQPRQARSSLATVSLSLQVRRQSTSVHSLLASAQASDLPASVAPLGNMLSSRSVATLYSFAETETPQRNGSAQASNHPFADSPSQEPKPLPESPPATDSPERIHLSPPHSPSRSSSPEDTANTPPTENPVTDPSRDEAPNVWYLRSARSTRFSQSQAQNFRHPPPRPKRKRPMLKWPNIKSKCCRIPLTSKVWTGCKRWVHFVWVDLLAMMIMLLAMYLCQLFMPNYRMCDRIVQMTYNTRSSEFEGPIQYSFPRYDARKPLDTTDFAGLTDPFENSRRTLLERNSCSMAAKVTVASANYFLFPPIPMTLGLELSSLIILLLMQIWVRSQSDFTAAKIGMTKALIVAYVRSPFPVSLPVLIALVLSSAVTSHDEVRSD